MMLVVAIALALGVLALVMLLPALRSARSGLSHSERLLLEDYRARLAELERELERGAADPETTAESRAAIEREMLANLPPEAGDAPAELPNEPAGSRPILLTAIALVPLLAIMVYTGTGRPDLLASPPSIRMSETQQREFAHMPPADRIEALEPWLEQRPRAGEGWVLLGHAYRAESRFDAATSAYARARDLLGDNPSLLAYHAEALLLANERRFNRRISRLLEQALAQDPDHGLALLLMGHAAMARDDNAAAIQHWERMAAQMPADSERRRIVETLIARAGGDAPTGSPALETPQASAETAPATDTVDGTRVAVNVALASDLVGEARAGDAVFIFARHAERGGPPLAVTRTTVADLPARIELSDADSMVAGNDLSSASRIVVGARVARGGTAEAQSGDLEGLSEPVEPGPQAEVAVRIDQRIP